MSFNGSGTFLINSTGQPVVANTVISATVFNALTADLASGLTNCITKDGQSTPTANIPMGSNKITGLANGTLASDAANLGQVQTTAAKLIGSIAGVDTITGIMSPTLTAYAAGQLFYFIASGANTGAVTLNIDGLGAKSVTRDGSTALAAGDINSGEIVVVIYDGTRFQMINAANSFGNTTINGTLTVTGKSNLAEVSTPSINASVAAVTALTATGASVASANVGTAVITSLQATGASAASINAGVALLTTATVTNLQATGASIASANIGNLQFTAASIASINAGVAVINSLTATGASIASANVGTALVTRLDVTGASAASMNANVALLTTATVTNLTATSASIASANVGTIALTRLDVNAASVASANAAVANVTDLRVAGASVTSANIGTALVTRLDVTGASAASMNANVALITTGTVTNLTATSASVASANAGTAAITTLTATQASVGSINAAVALVTNGTVTTLSGTQASITSINHAVVRLLGSSSGYVGLQGAAAAGSTTYTLPSADGSSGQVLSTNGSGVLSWATGGGGGSGDVVGPASATDNAITRFNLTTGKLIQNSTVILDDSGTITGVAALAAVTASITSANVGTAVITTLTATGASVASINAAVALVTTGTVTNLTSTAASIASANIGVANINSLSFTAASIASLNAGTATITSGNLTFTGTAQRITGDFSNGTASNRVLFQTSTANSTTNFGILPNGTGTTSQILMYNTSDTNNNSRLRLAINATEVNFISDLVGTGSYLPIAFYAGGSERMRLDTSGNLGIGTASPSYPLHVAGNTNAVLAMAVRNSSTGSSAYSFVRVGNDTDATAGVLRMSSTNTGYSGANSLCLFMEGSYPIGFVTNNAERMRITSGGDVYIGSTTDLGAAAQMQIVGAEADKLAMRCSDATAGNYWRLSVDSGNTFYVQNHNAAGVYITNGGTSWTGTSDERFKTDLKPIEDSLNKVCQLRSVTGRFKTDEEGISRSFLIAQDVLAVLPEAVDARNPEKLGVAYTDVIPLLVAAIKELSAKVAALEAK